MDSGADLTSSDNQQARRGTTGSFPPAAVVPRATINRPDGPDDSAQVPTNFAGGDAILSSAESVGTASKAISVGEYGPLFFLEDGNVQANQLAIAALFATEMPCGFEAEGGVFRKYNPAIGVWEACRKPEIKRLLAKFIQQQAETSKARAFLPRLTNAFLNAVIALLEGFPLEIDPERLCGIVHAANGMLDLTVVPSELRPFAPSYGSLGRCAIAYRPDATCPRLLEELLAPTIAPDDIDLVQRYCGAVMSGINLAQRFLIFEGEAARGKSVLVKIIEQIIGLDNVANLRTEHLGGRFETHGYLGKKLLSAKDVRSDFLQRRGAQMIKALVGDDLQEAERKFGGKYRFEGTFNIIVTSNNRLRLAMEDDEPAWRRRLLLIHFAGKPPAKRVANFADVLLREEGEGILAWFVAGAVKHRQELAERGDFRLTKAQQARIDDLLHSSRSEAVFVETRVTARRDADITSDELTQAYLDFCRSKGWPASSPRQFENVLQNLMQSNHGVTRRNDIIRGVAWARGYKHVMLKTEEAK